MTLPSELALMPVHALESLAHGMRTGGLSIESSPAELANKLKIEREIAVRLREKMIASRLSDANAIAISAQTAIEIRQRDPGLSSLVELVLSGPRVDGVPMRSTRVAFDDLVQQAREEILVTSFVARNARGLLSPLAAFLDQDPRRRVTIVLDFKRERDTTITELLAARLADDFWSNQWPESSRRPTLCYDPRGLAMDWRSQATMHAKVVVVDRRRAFITSANLTERAYRDNLELGVVVNDAGIAKQIADYFDAVIGNGALVKIA